MNVRSARSQVIDVSLSATTVQPLMRQPAPIQWYSHFKEGRMVATLPCTLTHLALQAGSGFAHRQHHDSCRAGDFLKYDTPCVSYRDD
jgi:hypothetical protein